VEVTAMQTVAEVVEDLIAAIRGGSVAVFYGAGVSRNSGLPIVSQLLPEMFAAVGIKGTPDGVHCPPRQSEKSASWIGE